MALCLYPNAKVQQSENRSNLFITKICNICRLSYYTSINHAVIFQPVTQYYRLHDKMLLKCNFLIHKDIKMLFCIAKRRNFAEKYYLLISKQDV